MVTPALELRDLGCVRGGRALFGGLSLDVASGRKKTWAEHWGLHNALAIFNPGPVT